MKKELKIKLFAVVSLAFMLGVLTIIAFLLAGTI